MESTHCITDCHGVTYRVHSERDIGWSFHIWHGDNVVGHMYCTGQPPVLQVGDFKLYDDVCVRESLAATCWRKLLGRPRPVSNYRNRGLGTAMFTLLSKLAKSADYKCLEGWISDVDTESNPGLPDWYRRRGYIVTEGAGKYARQVAVIRKNL